MNDLKGFKILVVDDYKEIHESLKTIFESVGADVQTAKDGLEAIEKATSSQFNLILMDLHMPGLSGKDAAVTIIKLPYPKKIVALTGDLSAKETSETMAVFDDFISKPFHPRNLVQHVIKILQPAATA